MLLFSQFRETHLELESNVNKGQRKVDICFLFLLLLNSFYGGKVKSFSAVCFLPTAKHRHKNLLGGSG